MRIAHFTDTFHPKVDGIVVSILNFSKKLIEQGHEVLVFAPKYKEMKSEIIIKKMTIKRYFSFSLSSYPGVKIAFPNFIKMHKVMREWKPDVIHIHTPGLIGYAGIIFAKAFNIPSIGTFHTLVTEQLTYISPKRLLKLDRLIDKISVGKKRDKKKIFSFLKKGLVQSEQKRDAKEGYAKKIVWKLATRVYNKCDKIIVPSKAIKTVLREHGIKKDIIVISNGIGLDLFKPKKNYREKNLRLICVGRISYEKNIDVVIKSIDIVRQVYPSILLEIIGPGPALPSLKKLVRSLFLIRNVKFLGKVDYRKLGSFYRNGDIFLTASTMETQGLVILEAMACGLPVIGVKKYAIPDLVINGRNGYVVEPFNERKMAGKIIILLENPALLKKFGKESVKLAKLHDVNKMSRKLERAYKEML